MTRYGLLILLLATVSISALADSNQDLIVFVGEKITIDEFQPELEPGERLMDGAFKAKYRIQQLVFGKYENPIIEFDVYDHYGRPPFEHYKNVLLFVSKSNNTLYHEKYQYFPVYKTKSGSWAGCERAVSREAETHELLMPVHNIEFNKDAYIDISEFSKDAINKMRKINQFKIVGNKAYCLKGNTIEELFEFKKKGVLKARGLFK